ncbi:MAG: aldolase/citrate lyase family protein [Lachnospiraceae bacterium]|nr:aldolase/citrate lyase family protein [Lachnospiraceae bacterium]
MALSLMYITNSPQVAEIAQDAGVNRLFVDMEYIGKEDRQAGMNTVKSHHTFSDIENIKNVTASGSSELLVRVNPIHVATSKYSSSKEEIETAIACGADILMLPMYRSRDEVDQFLSIVNGKVKTMLLLETKEACESAEEIVKAGGFDELHIGLNDLHLAYHLNFMFELLADGTVDRLAMLMQEYNIRFGFGGIARVGYGTLPAEYIIREHYRIGSQAAILSRSFCNANIVTDMDELKEVFKKGIMDIRACEKSAESMTEEELLKNHVVVTELVNDIKNKI